LNLPRPLTLVFDFTPPNPHTTLRLRQPNEWESPLHWQDVLMWRNQIHNIVINAFGSVE
jgi:hypothetical protein